MLKTGIDRVREFQTITRWMAETYAEKNNDYGNSFETSLEEWGPIAFLVRASDKWNRIKALTHGKQERRVKDETIRDTLLDLATYCIMFAMWVDKGGEK